MFSAHLQSDEFPADYSMTPPMHTVVVKGDMRFSKTNKPIGSQLERVVFSYCNDSDFRQGSLLGDPFLALYNGCCLMINSNIDVSGGIANGTVCVFSGLKLKRGPDPRRKEKINGRHVWTVHASDVESIVLHILKDGKKVSGAEPIELQTCTHKYVAKIPYLIPENKEAQNITMEQFPVILCTACTGHKLQGQSIDKLMVYEWHNAADWVYVVLSRVRTISGLFLRKELNPNHDYSMAEELIHHNDRLVRKKNNPNFEERHDPVRASCRICSFGTKKKYLCENCACLLILCLLRKVHALIVLASDAR